MDPSPLEVYSVYGQFDVIMKGIFQLKKSSGFVTKDKKLAYEYEITKFYTIRND